MTDTATEAALQKDEQQGNAQGGSGAEGGSKRMMRIEYFRSKNSTPKKHKLVVKGLGFTRLNQIVEREDTPSVRGMVKAIPHLVRVLE